MRAVWPLSGGTAALNAAASCASLRSISAGQQRNEVAGTRDTVYGSEATEVGETLAPLPYPAYGGEPCRKETVWIVLFVPG
jgi:hypothetical protein